MISQMNARVPAFLALAFAIASVIHGAPLSYSAHIDSSSTSFRLNDVELSFVLDPNTHLGSGDLRTLGSFQYTLPVANSSLFLADFWLDLPGLGGAFFLSFPEFPPSTLGWFFDVHAVNNERFDAPGVYQLEGIITETETVVQSPVTGVLEVRAIPEPQLLLLLLMGSALVITLKCRLRLLRGE
jgi:hypothetical protein